MPYYQIENTRGKYRFNVMQNSLPKREIGFVESKLSTSKFFLENSMKIAFRPLMLKFFKSDHVNNQNLTQSTPF